MYEANFGMKTVFNMTDMNPSDNITTIASKYPPLLLLNQLANFNKLVPEFNVISGIKDNIVKIELKLGTESWIGIGSSIKKAKHNASANALAATNLPKPVSKKEKCFNAASQTPTVKLNAFALSNGLEVKYSLIDKTKVNFIHPTNFNGQHERVINHCWMFTFKVDIGHQCFFGKGSSQQQAKHNAAATALDFFSKGLVKLPVKSEQINISNLKIEDGKSPITLVYERANASKMDVLFDLVATNGPPHLPEFVIKVQVKSQMNEDTVFTEFGSGRNKYQAKLKAAISVLDKLPVVATSKSIPTQNLSTTNTSPDTQEVTKPPEKKVLHPISRLIQIMHAKKQKEPTFTVTKCEKQQDRNWLFEIECKLEDGTVAVGTGGNKKAAKQQASENVLKLLGVDLNPPSEDVKSKTNKKKNKMKKFEGNLPVLNEVEEA